MSVMRRYGPTMPIATLDQLAFYAEPGPITAIDPALESMVDDIGDDPLAIAQAVRGVLVHRDWAPIGADRFYNLVKNGFFDDVRFFRVISNFMVQFGINGSPAVSAIWRNPAVPLKDDPVKQSNKRGYITFATGGPNTRTTQVFINFKDNAFLDGQGFSPFGEVSQGMEDVVDKLYSQYAGKPQEQFVQILNQGNAFLNKDFPKLDFVKTATIEP